VNRTLVARHGRSPERDTPTSRSGPRSPATHLPSGFLSTGGDWPSPGPFTTAREGALEGLRAGSVFEQLPQRTRG
jgi:hypothetical protein